MKKLILVFLMCYKITCSLQVTHGLSSDGIALLAFKQGVTFDPFQVLSNWNEKDADPCAWCGVTCSADLRVIFLNISGFAFARASSSQDAAVGCSNSSSSSSLPLSTSTSSGGDQVPCVLTGTIPPEFANLSQLQILSLPFNGLSGNIPAEIGYLKLLRILDLEFNALSGPIPDELGQLSDLCSLNLANNGLDGYIPAALSGCNHLCYLSLAGNMLSGAIPPSLGNLTNLQWLAVSSNLLSSGIPVELTRSCSRLEHLDLAGNFLTGNIPPNIANCSQLQSLLLSANTLSGNIPPDLGRLTNLQSLHLFMNNLSGELPVEIGSCSSLRHFDASANQLSGSIPEAFGNLSDLSFLNLSSNKLEGVIPQLENLQDLEKLILSRNHLMGGIPPLLGTLSSLIVLDLSVNDLDGNIPEELAKLSKLKALLLNNNSLSGSIPESLSNLTSLVQLNLAFNNLSDLAHRWREIQGCKKWQGLLEPALDAVLREEIMKYGEFAQATYDAFDNEKHSKYCGSSKYNKQKMLQEVGMGNFGYEVTKYLYAMANMDHLPKFFSRSKQADPWSKDSNWMGFVAVATDEAEIKRLGRRDIVISWRGTVTTLEWLANLHDYLTPLSPTHRSTEANSRGRFVNVESGFFNLYTSKKESTRYNKKSAAEQVKEEICRLVELYADEELSITITGHSLGGALASLCAFDIVQSKCNERELTKTSQSEAAHQISLEKGNKKNEAINVLGSTIPVSVFTYASPRIGNDAFRDRLEELGVNILRVVNSHDIVPKVPGLLVNESMFDMFGTFERFVGPWLDRLPWTYTHAGVELKLDQTASPFVKRKRDYAASHNLDLYLHLLDGFHSRSRPFEPAVGRDIALVNRYSDSLNDDLVVPSSWWQQENKGLIQNEAGVWVQPDRSEDDIPCPKAHERWL
ncbi:unnamed protein product [Sphagnum jensenii]|uniref:Fungal lipase-like domain-containing protein n=1 Tax=Sphagnum jensenii TaxID=128206 RepID=A0ABP1A5J5_9BRYO